MRGLHIHERKRGIFFTCFAFSCIAGSFSNELIIQKFIYFLFLFIFCYSGTKVINNPDVFDVEYCRFACDIFSIFFRSIHFLIPQSFICISRNDTFVFDVFGFLFLFTERFPTPVMQCRFPEVFEYRKVWRDLSGSTQIVVDDQMQVIRIRDAYPSYSLNSDGSGSQEVKLVMRCRTSHGTGGVQKFVVHTTTSEWYFHLKISPFFPIYVKIKKNSVVPR